MESLMMRGRAGSPSRPF